MKLTLTDMIKGILLRSMNKAVNQLMFKREQMILKSLRKYKWGADMNRYPTGVLGEIPKDNNIPTKTKEKITKVMYIVKINDARYLYDTTLSLDGDKLYRFTDDFTKAYQFPKTNDEYITNILNDTGGSLIKVNRKLEMEV